MFEGTPADPDDQAELQTTLKITSNSNYSAVLVRQSLAELMATNRVALLPVRFRRFRRLRGTL